MDTNEVKEEIKTVEDRSDKTRLFGNIKFNNQHNKSYI